MNHKDLFDSFTRFDLIWLSDLNTRLKLITKIHVQCDNILKLGDPNGVDIFVISILHRVRELWDAKSGIPCVVWHPIGQTKARVLRLDARRCWRAAAIILDSNCRQHARVHFLYLSVSNAIKYFWAKANRHRYTHTHTHTCIHADMNAHKHKHVCVCAMVCVCVCDIVLIAVCGTLINCFTSMWS